MTAMRLPYQGLSEAELCACARLQVLLDAIDPTGQTAARLHAECIEALAAAERERRSAV